jgi:hypothetical protein
LTTLPFFINLLVQLTVKTSKYLQDIDAYLYQQS